MNTAIQNGDELLASSTSLKNMFDVYLGTDYDKLKFRLVSDLQSELNRRHVEIYRNFNDRQIDASTYVDSVNALFFEIFNKIKNLLGQEDYEKLFGESSLDGFLIDKEKFLLAFS